MTSIEMRSVDLVMVTKIRDNGMRMQYALIGEFVCAFESVCAEMRRAIMLLGGRTGFDDQAFVQAITAELSAMPLLRSFQSVAIRKLTDPFEKQVLDIIYKKIDALISFRNSVLHATWYINYASEGQTDFSVGLKLKNTKGGVTNKSLTVSEEGFRPFIEEGWDLAELVHRFAMGKCTEMDFGENFNINDGILSVPVELKARR